MFMKNQFLVFCLAAGIFCLSGCRNDALEEVVSFSVGEPTRTEFTFQAGLGSISLQASGSLAVTAESSAPEWCRVAVYDNSSVVYNVDTNRSDQSRTATITVSVDGVPSESFEITQSRFTGLLVTPNELTFSEEVTEISVEVISACEYDIMWDRNDENVFSVEKSSDGRVLTFRSPLPGVYSRQGELRLVPEPAEGESLPGAEEVVISLDLPRMSSYRIMLGEWKVDRFSNNDITSVTLEEDIYGETYRLYLNGIDKVEDLPLIADYVADEHGYENGRVFIRTAQKMGVLDSEYYNLHFNGTINNVGTYIFSTENDNIAWAAEPVLDDETETISLSFADSGLGRGSVAVSFVIWRGTSGYFDFKENLVSTDVFEISKGYPETDPAAGEDTGTDGTDN